MKRLKSRIHWIARALRWKDRRRETVPSMTLYEASLFQACDGYRMRRRTVRTH